MYRSYRLFPFSLSAILVFSFLVISTGTMAQETKLTVPEQVQLAKAFIPGLKKIAIITTVKETQTELKQLVLAGKTYSVTFDIYDVPSVAETREAFQRLAGSHPNLIWLLNDSITNNNFGRRLILERSLASRIPVYSCSRDFLREGALFAAEKDSSGEIVTLLNDKIGTLLGVEVPADFTTKVTRVSQ